MRYRVEYVVSAERGKVVSTDLIGEAAAHHGDLVGGSAQRVGPYQVSVVVNVEAASDAEVIEAARAMRFHYRSHDLGGISVGRGRSHRRVA